MRSKYCEDTLIPPWKTVEYLYIKKLLDTKSNDKILEVGCGVGKFIDKIVSNEIFVVGIDISTKAVKQAKQNFDKKYVESVYFLVSDAQQLPFKNNTFTKACAVCTLEHIPNDEQAAKEINRVLKDKGFFVFSVPRYLPANLENIAFKFPKKIRDIIFRSERIRNSQTYFEAKEKLMDWAILKRVYNQENLQKLTKYFEIKRQIYYWKYINILLFEMSKVLKFPMYLLYPLVFLEEYYMPWKGSHIVVKGRKVTL